MPNLELPGRYSVVPYGTKGPYLDDGSNFVAWVDGKSDAEVLALVHADMERKEGYRRAYIEAMEAGKVGPHNGCDHAYGICLG